MKNDKKISAEDLQVTAPSTHAAAMQYAHNVDVPMLHTMQSTTVNGVFITTTLTHVAMIHP